MTTDTTTTVQLTDAQLAQFTACGVIVVDGEPQFDITGEPDDYEDGWDIWDFGDVLIHRHTETGDLTLYQGPKWDLTVLTNGIPLVAPELWRKLTEPCATCEGDGVVGTDQGWTETCPDCVSGRQVVTLKATCPQLEHHRHLTDGHWHDDCHRCIRRRKFGGTGCECTHRVVTLGRFTIRLLPVVSVNDVLPEQWPRPKCVVVWLDSRALIMSHNATDGTWVTKGHVDPLPQPGQWAVQFEAVAP